jgi:hypothetical protein
LFDASVSVLRPGAGAGFLVVLEQLVVMEWVPPSSFEVLLGLDVLQHLWFLYDGPRKEATLGD